MKLSFQNIDFGAPNREVNDNSGFQLLLFMSGGEHYFNSYFRGVNQLEEEKMRRNEEELKKISSGIGKVKMLLRDA